MLTGAGQEAFSSGFDLSELDPERFHREHEPAYEEAMRSLASFPYPTIAKVNGDAIGGGFDLCTCCDLRVSVDQARFGVPTARIGIVYTERAIRQMVQIVGPTYTKELLFTAEPIGASRAAEIGFVNGVVTAGELDERVDNLTATIAENAPHSLTASKRIVETILDTSQPSRTEREFIDRLRAEAFQSEDFEEGLRAIAEERKPDFTGE